MTGRLAKWALAIQEFCLQIRCVPEHANIVADSLSRNVGALTADPTPVENFSLHQLAVAQREHNVYKAVIHALDSSNETSLPPLPVPFLQFFLSSDGVLCRFWPSKRQPVEQYAIPEAMVPAVLHLTHDAIVAGYPGRERTLTAVRTQYFWPTLKVDTEKHVERCVRCAQYKGVPSGPAPILEYPTAATNDVLVLFIQLEFISYLQYVRQLYQLEVQWCQKFSCLSSALWGS